MRRKLKTLKCKSGHSENGSPRTLLDLAVYREFRNRANSHLHLGLSVHWDSQYAGWSWASRPRDSAIVMRAVLPYPSPPPP